MQAFSKCLILVFSITLVWSAGATASPSEVAKSIEASMLVTGSIVVATDGKVSQYELDQPEKLPPLAKEVLQKSIPGWTFEPVLKDGKPVLAKTEMAIRLVANQQADGAVAVRVSGATFGDGKAITYKDRATPRYPRQAIKNRVQGTVYMLLKIGRDGTVLEVAAEQVNLGTLGNQRELSRWRKWLAESATRAGRQWTFHVPTTGIDADAPYWVVRTPISYSLSTGRRHKPSPAYGEWTSYIPGPEQAIPWADPSMLAGAADAVPNNSLQLLNGHGLHRKATL